MVHQRKCCIFFAAGSSHTTTRSETPLRKLKVFYEATTTYAALPQGKREQKTLRLHWIGYCVVVVPDYQSGKKCLNLCLCCPSWKISTPYCEINEIYLGGFLSEISWFHLGVLEFDKLAKNAKKTRESINPSFTQDKNWVELSCWGGFIPRLWSSSN